ncbi:inosine/uridine-preferring nucleoside hydrolase [Cercophora newfieldiana]|uniref:Inosine/uridine-preferring nucleoside hydrolase n=1 Tax=Cercophora newfieldiana TaxID=92897 RepID=A0AA39XUE4_9PEZI|nr:inosine/uridine-preferring nucleoside hydrolase [Cercophora newfieldiana]
MRVLFPFVASLIQVAICLAKRKNIIIDTDLFSDVDDVGALMLTATSPEANLIAVNINYPAAYSVIAASALLCHYGQPQVPIGIMRPLTNETFFDDWSFRLGEYASKIAYHFPSGSIPWGHAEDAWDPVELYRKVLAESEDASVTIVSIGFLDNLSALLNSTGDEYSDLNGRELISQKVSEFVVMGGAYPSGKEWNFFGSNPSAAAHAVNTWEGRVTFVGDEVGKDVLTGGPLMKDGPKTDLLRQAFIYYTYFDPRPSWDALAVMYGIHGLGDLFEVGNEYGYNHVEPDGANKWIWDEMKREQQFLLLKASNETAAAKVDRLFLKGARSAAPDVGGTPPKASCAGRSQHEEL